jgi:uncharacterized protein (TIGR02118 family)
MIKISLAMQRAPSLTHEAFADFYQKEYLPLLMNHYKASIGCIFDLADNRPLIPNHMGPNFKRSPYDGITALYFRELDEFLSDYNSQKQNELLTAQEEKLLSETHVYHLEEVVHWDNLKARREGVPSPGFKILPFSCRNPHLFREEFAEHYRNVHSSLAREHHPGVGRYVQNFVQATLSTDAPEIDAFAELHFPSFEDYRDRFYARAESPRIIGKDVTSFADLTKLHYLTAKELIIKKPD